MKNVKSGRTVDVTIVGGGMITNDLLLPSIYHLQRRGVVGSVNICSLNNPPLKGLKENKEIQEAFPNQDFTAYPSLPESPKKNFPELLKEFEKMTNDYEGYYQKIKDEARELEKKYNLKIREIVVH